MRAGLAAGVVCSLLPLLPFVANARVQTPADPDTSVAIGDALSGHSIEAVTGGELRIVARDDGPTMSLEELRIEGKTAPEPIERTWRLPSAEPCYLVSRFERARTHRLGGSFDTWAREPATATARLTAADDERFLRFDYRRPPDTWAGLRIDFFDGDPGTGTRWFVDATDREAIVFRARGGIEDVVVKLADADGRRRGDGVEVGTLAEFMHDADPVTGWSQFRVPLRVRGLDHTRLARLLLQPRNDRGTLEIDDLFLCERGATPSVQAGVSAPVAPRALWVWSTRRILATDGEVHRLIDLAREARITRVYLQLPGEFLEPDHDFTSGDGAPLRPLLRALTDAGIEAHALDGAPDYALADKHDRVVDTVRRIAAFNRASAAGERFEGVHFDIEPYLLEAWSGASRDEVVGDFLHLFDRLQEAAAAANLWLEAAVPFWFDGVPAPATREGGAPVARSLFEGLAARVDAVVVMDYRTEIEGSNGVLALAENELAVASARGATVLIALETGPLPDAVLVRFRGAGREGLPPGEGDWVVAVGGEEPRLLLARTADGVRSRIGDPEGPAWHWPVSARIPQPASRLTFRGGNGDLLRRQLAAAERALRGYPAFGGFALHHYETLLRLLYGEPHGR